MTGQLPPAGWYPDSTTQRTRWWDGTQWTDQFQDDPDQTGEDSSVPPSKWKNKDWWFGRTEEQQASQQAAKDVLYGRTELPDDYEWPSTAMPLNKRRISKAATRSVARHRVDQTDPWLILAPGMGVGLVAAWDDRLSVIKTGSITGLMAGSLGGERAATFHFTDITGIEYNSGLVNGVLEILTASYSGTANKDAWGGFGKSRNADNNDPWTLSNTLPLAKLEYNLAQAEIGELRRRIGDSKRPTAAQAAGPDVTVQLKNLAELHATGVLTDEEFAVKKAQLLNRL